MQAPLKLEQAYWDERNARERLELTLRQLSDPEFVASEGAEAIAALAAEALKGKL